MFSYFTKGRDLVRREGDAGYDIFALTTGSNSIVAGETLIISTGVYVACDRDHVIIVKERSSLGARGLAVRMGVIDSSYRGEVLIGIQNNTKETQMVHTDRAIAQLVVIKLDTSEAIKLSGVEYAALNATTRGEGSMGSTDGEA